MLIICAGDSSYYFIKANCVCLFSIPHSSLKLALRGIFYTMKMGKWYKPGLSVLSPTPPKEHCKVFSGVTYFFHIMLWNMGLSNPLWKGIMWSDMSQRVTVSMNILNLSYFMLWRKYKLYITALLKLKYIHRIIFVY